MLSQVKTHSRDNIEAINQTKSQEDKVFRDITTLAKD